MERRLLASGVQASVDVSFAGQQPGRGIESHPAAPGRYTSVQACRSVKSAVGPAGLPTVSRRYELNQIAGDEARRESQMAHDLD